jgi:2-deoxy-D-gluconate 3-dehydrogenase
MSHSELFDLSGQVAVVTGGNGGLGRGITIGLAKAGAAIAVLGRNETKNSHVLAELKAIGIPCMAISIDLTRRENLLPAFKSVEVKRGSVDILVNNAGNVSVSGGVMNEAAADWDNVIATHLHATFLLSKIAAEGMLSRKSGKIINIASIYSFFGSGRVPSYSTAKGAIIQLTKSMAIEFAASNVQVNAIAPGWFETDMTAAVKTIPAIHDEIMLRTPAGRWGQADELAGAAIFLASRASDFVTGTTVVVDGGYSIR